MDHAGLDSESADNINPHILSVLWKAMPLILHNLENTIRPSLRGSNHQMGQKQQPTKDALENFYGAFLKV